MLGSPIPGGSGDAMDLVCGNSSDDEQWTTVNKNKKRKTSNSYNSAYASCEESASRPSSRNSTSVRSTSRSSNVPQPTNNNSPDHLKPVYQATLSNLPRHMRTPKGISVYLKMTDIPVVNIIALRNGNLIIKSTSKNLSKKLEFLKQVSNSNFVAGSVTLCNKFTSTASKPSFSCVIVGVELDVEVADIEKQLTEDGHQFSKIWRIKSRQTNKETRLMRVISTDEASIHHLLSFGFRIFYKHHTVEASRAPQPQPLQCKRCNEFHKSDVECHQPIRCSRCSGKHHANQCKPTQQVKCSNCGKEHMATDLKCPSRPSAPVDEHATLPVKCIESSHLQDVTKPATHQDIIRVVTTALMNAMPLQRDRITNIMSAIAFSTLNTRMTVSYSRNKLLINCNPLKKSFATAAST